MLVLKTLSFVDNSLICGQRGSWDGVDVWFHELEPEEELKKWEKEEKKVSHLLLQTLPNNLLQVGWLHPGTLFGDTGPTALFLLGAMWWTAIVPSDEVFPDQVFTSASIHAGWLGFQNTEDGIEWNTEHNILLPYLLWKYVSPNYNGIFSIRGLKVMRAVCNLLKMSM